MQSPTRPSKLNVQMPPLDYGPRLTRTTMSPHPLADNLRELAKTLMESADYLGACHDHGYLESMVRSGPFPLLSFLTSHDV